MKTKTGKYNINDILDDGRKIINKIRISSTEYEFLLYCKVCDTEQIIKRTSGLSRKCIGCSGKIWKYDTEKDRENNKIFTNYKYRAIKKGYEFSLTRVAFLKILTYPCYWCGFSGKVGIDRVNNNIGYILENSVACCKNCNYAKNNMELSEWLEWLDRILKYRSNS